MTLLTTSALLLFVYAGFREDQVIYLTNHLAGVNREVFFFLALGTILWVNFMPYALAWTLRKKDQPFIEFVKGWLMGLAALLNFFLVVVLGFVHVYNGGERFNYANFGFLVFVSLGLVAIWTLILPAYMIRKRVKNEVL